MARRRALIACLGTTGVLLAFAALLLAVVGALIGFNGWPGGGDVDSAEGVSIDQARLISAEPPSFAAVVPREAREARRAQRRRVSRQPRERGLALQDVAGAYADNRTESNTGAGSGGGAVSGSARSGSGPAADGVSDDVAGTVQELTHGAAGIGDPAAPVGGLVRDTGSAVSGAVRELGGEIEAQLKARAPHAR